MLSHPHDRHGVGHRPSRDLKLRVSLNVPASAQVTTIAKVGAAVRRAVT
jgi:hypothetical protein